MYVSDTSQRPRYLMDYVYYNYRITTYMLCVYYITYACVCLVARRGNGKCIGEFKSKENDLERKKTVYQPICRTTFLCLVVIFCRYREILTL